MPDRWFVISHEATNSGAPRMLLRVLRGVREICGSDWSCEILFRHGGVLMPEFAELGPVHVLARSWAEGRSLRAGVWRKFLDRPWLQPRRLARWMPRWEDGGFGLVYNNTATNGYIVEAARRLDCPILTHVHELSDAMRRFNTPAALAKTVVTSDHFIAVSRPVADDLIECGAREERVAVVPNFLEGLPGEPGPGDVALVRRRLGLDGDSCVITGCGHIDGVKGPDLFVEVAAALAERMQRKLCFVWLGGVTDARFVRRLRALVKRRNLADVVRWVGPVDDPMRWFVASDAVAVTSRSESFSLVALEAAAVGRPVVGFAGARGLGSVLGDTAELLAPGHDPRAMAALLQMLLLNPERAHALGQRLRARVAAEFLATPCVEKILSVVENVRQLPRRA